MNNPLDLDAMRGRWQTLDARLDDTLALDLAHLRAALSQRVRSAFRRHSAWLIVALVFDAAALLALVAFGVSHWREPIAAACALALLLLMAMEARTDLHAWRTLRTLDFDAPVLAVRSRLVALRARRVRTTFAFVLFSIALWLPAANVILIALVGVDLFAVLHWSVPVANLVVGLLLLPFGAWLGRSAARRFVGRAGYERFLDDAAGTSWRHATGAWSAYADAQSRMDDGDGAALLQTGIDGDTLTRAVAVAVPLRALRRALWLGIVVFGVPILAVALFNATHGGSVRFLVPGLLLHVGLLVHLVANIAHLHALRGLDPAAPVQALAEAIDAMAARRAALARWALVLAPLFALPLVAVLAKAAADIDVLAAWPAIAQFAAVAQAAVLSAVLSTRRRQIGARWLDALCTGGLRRSATLRDALLAHRADSG